MTTQIRALEERSFNAHPSLNTQFYDGWVLRFANGFTNRANSVNMLYPSVLDLETKIAECERRYSAQQLSCVFKIIEGEHSEIDALLAQRGYEVATPTYLEILDLNNTQFRTGNCISFDKPEQKWLDSYFEFEKYSEASCRNAKLVLNQIQNKSIYCSLIENDECVACASSVLENGYAIIGNVVVKDQCRGRGYGKLLCESLLSEIKKAGAHTAYLQVVQTNAPAVKLYAGLGFKQLYSYWYRVKKII